ncbi:hypothetical protein B2A_04505 [mine drainage metagenome]|uniref:DUF4143 domain-containing protein n=1 Tax=mine drainage metagenome TaxID=410659 RepID=T1ABK0_9ZZZZ
MESRKLKKVYPYNVSLALAVNAIEFAYLAETVVASAADVSNYWRMGVAEVDFVVREPMIPIEVKSGARVRDDDLKSIKGFMERFGAQKGIVVYWGDKEEIRGRVHLLPILDFLARGLSDSRHNNGRAGRRRR